MVVACFCGCQFTIDGPLGACPHCGQPAEAPAPDPGVIVGTSTREVHAMLRGAVKTGLLSGWYYHGDGPARRYIVSPPGAATSTYDPPGVLAYCAMLRLAGIDPVFRRSEPDQPLMWEGDQA